MKCQVFLDKRPGLLYNSLGEKEFIMIRGMQMSNPTWPAVWPVRLGALEIDLPLVKNDDGFQIYAFDSMGRTAWNIAAAQALARRLAGYDFDILLTAESKANAAGSGL